MSNWRSEAVKLFPEYCKGVNAFHRSDMTIYQVFFVLLKDLDQKIEQDDYGWLDRVFQYIEWCYAQKKRVPDVWNAASTAFLEHMADKDERAILIPRHVKPAIFVDLWNEFKKRREREGEGRAEELLSAYNNFHSTQFNFYAR